MNTHPIAQLILVALLIFSFARPAAAQEPASDGRLNSHPPVAPRHFDPGCGPPGCGPTEGGPTEGARRPLVHARGQPSQM